MKTSFENITVETSANVYEPLEDSLMLGRLVKSQAHGKVLDVGTGSGLQAIIAASKSEVESVLAVDLNSDALKEARENAFANNVGEKIVFLKSDLFEKVPEKKLFDTIIFNPPYLPTSEDEKLQKEINLAFDGGEDGRKTLDLFLHSFEKHLSPQGVLLLVQSSLCDEKKTLDLLHAKGFDASVVEEEKFFFEKIMAIKAKKKPQIPM